MAKEKKVNESDLSESISMLEQILEVMPQDLMTLRALYNAYSQYGRREKAFEHLDILANAASDCNDHESVGFLLNQLEDFKEEYPSETSLLIARVQAIQPVGEKPEAALSKEKPETVPDADIGEELALAWKLYEENQFSQEEYSSILHDLTEVSSKEVDVPVSVLHVLCDRSFNQINRIMNYMSSRSGVPCISLLNFELPETVADVLPLDVSARDGALPFGFFGDNLLVAVLNPFNNMLIEKVEKDSGRRCHTFLVSAEEYDAALGKLREMAA